MIVRGLAAVAAVVAVATVPALGLAAEEESPEPARSAVVEPEVSKAPPTCFGRAPTIVALPGVETFGTKARDVIVGTDGDDIIHGGAGDDLICAGAGADHVAGDAGNDRILGGPGADTINGGKGHDRLSGSAGDDVLDGGKGNDRCSGGAGHDWLPDCHDTRSTKGALRVRRHTKLNGPHAGTIVIAANDVTLDCQGHSVKGRGSGVGIMLENRRGVTVKDCDVSNFTEGINLTGSDRNRLEGNSAHENGRLGIVLSQSSRNRLTGNVADENGFGGTATGGIVVWLASHHNVLKRNSASGNGEVNFALSGYESTLVDNTASDSLYGITIGGDHNEIRGNRVTGAYDHGVFLSRGDDNQVRDNTVTDSGVGFTIEGRANTIVANTALDSRHRGFEERGEAGSNEYADNVCIGYGERGSSPDGLCSSEPPAAPAGEGE